MAVEVQLMGAVELTCDGRSVSVGGPRQQMVLAVLALSAGAPVGTDRIVDLVWDDRPPRTVRRTVQSYVAALRRTIGPGGPLASTSGGYVLDVPRGAVDLLSFEDVVAGALSRTDAVPDATASVLATALGNWRTPLELAQPNDRVQGLLAPFEELRLQAVEALVVAQIASGDAAAAVRRLEQLVRLHPTREHLWLQLGRGLAALGRRDDALLAVQRARESLRLELGVDPSRPLLDLEHELLGSGRADSGSIPGSVAPPRPLPSGRVTFVFTDIEGSTRLLRSLGDDGYHALLADHHRILRAAWSANDGHEVNTEGDSFFVVFEDAASAVSACVAAQEGLDAHVWPSSVAVRVRMGIHTGLGAPRGGDYAALAVNEASRIAEAAHGGQVLVSSTAAAALPAPFASRLHPLGRFRVRDFDDPVSLLGVDTGSSSHRRAPRVVPAEGHNLPESPGTFVGRVGELDRLVALVDSEPLVTVTGPGGVGKTRLAVEVGRRSASAFPDGVWLVSLDSVEHDEVVDDAIAEAFGIAAGKSDLWTETLGRLTGARSLLVLDNCEHVLAGCIDRVADVMTSCPTVSVLATSRAPLGMLGERVVRLAPLDNSSSESRPSDAVRLFADRAGEAVDLRSERVLYDVGALCSDLDGLPLAIELAAARADTMPPSDIAGALARRSPALSTRDPRVPERQRSLERTLDWSCGLLDAVEHVALRRLSTFASAFDLATASAAIGDDEIARDVVPDLIWSLAAKSLVVVEPAAGSTRFRLLRTVRSYLADRLPDDERVAVCRRLVSHFVDTLGPQLALDRSWVGDVDEELSNLRSLVTVDGTDEPLRQRLAWVIARFHDLTDNYAAGTDELDRHLAVLASETPERAALLTLSADLRMRVGDMARAQRAIDAAAALTSSVGPVDWDDAGVLRTRGELAMRAGRLDEARRIVEEALDADLSRRGQARLLDLLGLTLSAAGDLDGSARAFERESELWTALGDDSFVASTLGNLAETEWRAGRFAAAARHQSTCLEIARSLGQPVMIAFAMIMAAQFSARDGHWEAALRLQLTADSMLDDAGYVLYDSDAAARSELLRAARDHVGSPVVIADEIDNNGRELDATIELAVRTLAAAGKG